MLISFDMLEHIRYMQKAIIKHSLNGGINMENFSVAIRREPPNLIRLVPQFLSIYQGKKLYYPNMTDETKKFIGWRPYNVRTFELTKNKIKFKENIKEKGFKTPEYSESIDIQIDNVIVKRKVASFSEGIRGPYKKTSDTSLNLKKGEYFEQFIPGKIVKIWFFEKNPVAAEVADMPYLIGDGKSSIRELLNKLEKSVDRELDVAGFENLLRYHDKNWGSVLEKSIKFIVDFKYGSDIPVSKYAYDVNIGKDDFFNLEDELSDIGDYLYSIIPDELRENIVYVVDGIVDQDNKLWLLEVNSNPFIHPYVYEPMIGKLAKQLEQDEDDSKVVTITASV